MREAFYHCNQLTLSFKTDVKNLTVAGGKKSKIIMCGNFLRMKLENVTIRPYLRFWRIEALTLVFPGVVMSICLRENNFE